MRTCLACRRLRPKQELIRLACVADGHIYVDYTGKMAGRGAYLCPVAECWEDGLIKGNRVEYTLRTHLSQTHREQLLQYGKSLRRVNWSDKSK